MFRAAYSGRVNHITDVRILRDAYVQNVVFEETVSLKDGISGVKDCVFIQSLDHEWDDGIVWQRAGQDNVDQSFKVYLAVDRDLMKKTLELKSENECYRVIAYYTSQLRPHLSPSTDARLYKKIYKRSVFLSLIANRAEVDKRLSDIEFNLPEIEEAIHLKITELNEFTA